MSNTVIKVSNEMINKMKEYYSKSILEKIPTGAIFTAKLTGCTITAYRSGKVMFQGNLHSEEANKWGGQTSINQTQTKINKTSGKPLPHNISTLSLIGSDEVGTGDYFGPITVVSAFVKREQLPLLQELGVKDSKNLSDKQIVTIAKDLLHVIPYSLLILHNEKYNQLQEKGMTQGKMKALLHNKALNNLLKKIPEKPEAVLIDQFVEADTYFRHLKGQKEICTENVYFSTKGESVHLAVAAASILARYAFIQEFDKLSIKAGFTLPKGAGHQVDKACAQLIKNKGRSALKSFAKIHFANTEKALKLI